MTTNPIIVNLGELSKPATVLIEKISDAVGGIFKPRQIRRIAEASADAEKILAITRIEISELQERGLHRFLIEEGIKQTNIEEITKMALPLVDENATPRDMENDWIANFFDRSRLISDDEMQILWSKVLAGEANSPGTYSKRTVNILGSLDKSDGVLFQALCGFAWFFNDLVPLIYEAHEEIYNNFGINFDSLTHLDEIGLLSFDNLAGYQQINLPKKISISYYENPIDIEFEKENSNELPIGRVILSKVGRELAPITGSKPVPEFYDYIIEEWTTKKGLCVSSPIRTKINGDSLGSDLETVQPPSRWE